MMRRTKRRRRDDMPIWSYANGCFLQSGLGSGETLDRGADHSSTYLTAITTADAYIHYGSDPGGDDTIYVDPERRTPEVKGGKAESGTLSYRDVTHS